MMLAASPGCCIEVSASGEQAETVLNALQVLIADKFGEEC
jgi:phosphocarrier protein